MSKTLNTNFVIAISSHSGGGKTTLVKNTAKLLNNAATLFFDPYASKFGLDYPDIDGWIKGGADLNVFKTPEFARDVRALRDGKKIVSILDETTITPTKFIIIEDITGRSRDEMKDIVDFVVFIDTPIEVAYIRRLLRDIDFIPPENVISHLKSDLNTFLYAERIIISEFIKQVKLNCDLILDGNLHPDKQAEKLANIVKSERKIKNH